MTLDAFIVSVLEEAGTKGIYKKRGLIRTLCNEEYKAIAAQFKFPQLLIVNHKILLTSPGQVSAATPSNLQHLEEDSVRYSPSATLDDTVYLIRREFSGDLDGTPRYYQRAGVNLEIYPNADTAIGDAIYLNYYKTPTALSAGADVFFDEMVIPIIRTRVLMRMTRSTKASISEAYREDSRQAMTQLRSILL